MKLRALLAMMVLRMSTSSKWKLVRPATASTPPDAMNAKSGYRSVKSALACALAHAKYTLAHPAARHQQLDPGTIGDLHRDQ